MLFVYKVLVLLCLYSCPVEFSEKLWVCKDSKGCEEHHVAKAKTKETSAGN